MEYNTLISVVLEAAFSQHVAATDAGSYNPRDQRRGAGAVDRGGLENRCTLMGTEGSNPSLSARADLAL